MTVDYLARLYICAIIVVGTCLYLAVDGLEPCRLAVVLKCAILATGGAAIVDQLA